MVRRGEALVLIFVLGMPFVTFSIDIEFVKPTTMNDELGTFEMSYDVHSPFNITSDVDFETQG